MSTKTKTATNGHATAADVAQSAPPAYTEVDAAPAPVDPIPIRPALAARIMARQDEVEQSRAALDAAISARDDMIALAREIEAPPADWIPWRTTGDGLIFVPPPQG